MRATRHRNPMTTNRRSLNSLSRSLIEEPIGVPTTTTTLTHALPEEQSRPQTGPSLQARFRLRTRLARAEPHPTRCDRRGGRAAGGRRRPDERITHDRDRAAPKGRRFARNPDRGSCGARTCARGVHRPECLRRRVTVAPHRDSPSGRHPKSGSQAGYALPTRPIAVGSWLSLPSNTWLRNPRPPKTSSDRGEGPVQD